MSLVLTTCFACHLFGLVGRNPSLFDCLPTHSKQRQNGITQLRVTTFKTISVRTSKYAEPSDDSSVSVCVVLWFGFVIVAVAAAVVVVVIVVCCGCCCCFLLLLLVCLLLFVVVVVVAAFLFACRVVDGNLM
ncbi:unnamed protein product [Polarella glacialis]|uniref:Transmembrane protein n=1 Tax=Polarella glacialis TaxID=89957 RepID=A0A813L8P9_POLGL|nr:unnamed protein product [Polarella glacialis]